MNQLQKIIAAIRVALTPRRKLDRIVGTFSKTVADLRALSIKHDCAVNKNASRINALHRKNSALFAEADEAERVADNIEKLFKS